jgi:hypothetical protein
MTAREGGEEDELVGGDATRGERSLRPTVEGQVRRTQGNCYVASSGHGDSDKIRAYTHDLIERVSARIGASQ